MSRLDFPLNSCYIPYQEQEIYSQLQSSQQLTELYSPGFCSVASEFFGISHKLPSMKRIGNYQFDLRKPIGKGYSSTVYAGKSDSHPKEQFAIKVINLSKISKSNLEMLSNEIQILKKIDHPHVIKCFDIYKSQTNCYIVTELCKGGDLLEKISKEKVISERKALEIADEVCSGLKYLHSKGIIHRDLKPANLLKGKGGWKICDFGFAIESNSQVKTKFNVGTPLYMAKESLIENIYSFQTDIFSLGIIVYEMLVGVTPWECRNQDDLIKKMTNQSFRFPSNRQKISNRSQRILRSMCSIDRRYRMTLKSFLQTTFTLENQDLDQQNPQIQSTEKQSQFSPRNTLIRHKSVDSLRYQRSPRSKDTLVSGIDCSLMHPSCLKVSIDELPKDGSRHQQYLKKSLSNQNLKLNPRSSPQKLLSSLIETPKENLKKSGTAQKSSSQLSIPTQSIRLSEKDCYHIVTNLIHFSRFLFYLHKNSEYMLLSQTSRDKLSLIVLKKAIIINSAIQNFSVSNTLGFGQTEYSEFIKSEVFKADLKEAAKTYKSRCEVEYLNLLKSCLKNQSQSQKSMEILEMMPFFRTLESSDQTHSSLSGKLFEEYLQKIESQVTQLIKECQQNVDVMVGAISKASTRAKPKQNRFIQANLVGLNNLKDFERLVVLARNLSLGSLQFQRQSKIRVNIDYLPKRQ